MAGGSHLMICMCSAWIITCILFVFGALSGYAGLLFKKNRLTAEDHEVTRNVSMTQVLSSFVIAQTLPTLSSFLI